MTNAWTPIERQNALTKAEADGTVADSMDVRIAIVQRVHSGELTLGQAQAELARIKREAKASGLLTRGDFYMQEPV